MRCVCDEVPSSSVRYFLPASYIVPHFQDTSYIQIAQWGPKRAICGSHHFDNISLLFYMNSFPSNRMKVEKNGPQLGRL